MNILITGVAGFIGSRMATWILDNKPEYKIVGIDDLSGGYLENVDNRVIFIKRDINDSLDDVFNL